MSNTAPDGRPTAASFMAIPFRTWERQARRCAVAALVLVSLHATAFAGQAPTPAPRVDPLLRRGLDGVPVPFPDSIDPPEVMANIQEIVRKTGLVEASGIEELGQAQNLRIRRIIRVRCDIPEFSPGYIVVELVNPASHPVATVAMTRTGALIGVEDVRGLANSSRSLDTADAVNRVRARRGRAPSSADYVYFFNVAEPGGSLFRPLVEVRTELGAIYLNSRGEAFIDDGSPLQAEVGESTVLRRGQLARILRAVGQW